MVVIYDRLEDVVAFLHANIDVPRAILSERSELRALTLIDGVCADSTEPLYAIIGENDLPALFARQGMLVDMSAHAYRRETVREIYCSLPVDLKSRGDVTLNRMRDPVKDSDELHRVRVDRKCFEFMRRFAQKNQDALRAAGLKPHLQRAMGIWDTPTKLVLVLDTRACCPKWLMQKFGNYLCNPRGHFVDVVILCAARDEIPKVLRNNEAPPIFAKMPDTQKTPATT